MPVATLPNPGPLGINETGASLTMRTALAQQAEQGKLK